MGSVCSTKVIPVIKVDKGDSKTDTSQWEKRKVRTMETESSSKEEKQPWIPPDPTPMPKGIILTPEPSRLNVEDNGARLSVGMHTPGSDALSPSGSSLRSSTDCSVTSSSRSIMIQDRGRAPPRLLSLSSDLHQLLMGRLEDTSRIQSHPKVIHLHLIAPSDDCTWERRALWQETFVPLRKTCAERGYTLDIRDDLWSPYDPLAGCVKDQSLIAVDAENVDALVILLTEDQAYNLPDHLTHKHFQIIQDSIQAGDEASLLPALKSLYQKNNSSQRKDSTKLWLQRHEVFQVEKQRLSRLVSRMVQSMQAAGVDTSSFLPHYYSKLKSLLTSQSLLQNGSVVVSRTVSHIMNFDATSGYDFDPSTSGDEQGELVEVKKAVQKECPVRRRVKLELPRGASQLHREKDLNKTYTKEMGVRVCTLMTSILETIIDDRQAGEHNAVTGVSQSLIDELVTQAKRSRKLTQTQPMFFSSTCRSLQDYIINFTEMPIVVYAPPGWGLSTLGAQLMEYCKREIPNALIMYRSLGVSPDTITLQSALLSLHQQLATILGNTGQWEEDLNAFPTKRLLSDIVSRSTAHLPIIIFLEGVTVATSKLKELEVMTLPESLPPTTKLIVMTNDEAVTRGLRLKMKDAFYVRAVSWEKQAIADIFSKTISDRKLVLSDPNSSIIANAIKQCPLPLFAVTAAQTVFILSQNGQLSSGLNDFPVTMEGIVQRLFECMENNFPTNCFPWLMRYFCASVGGPTDWEINDLLSTNDSVLDSIFTTEKELPILHRAPTNLWRSFKRVLKPFLHTFISTHFSTLCWSSSTMRTQATERYISNSGMSESLHKDMGEYFKGKWAYNNKEFPVSDNSPIIGDSSSERFVTPQPTKYGSKLNVRKLLCLPYHTMHYESKSSLAVDKFILNLPWVVYKLDAVSCLQFLLDLELAKGMEFSYTHPNDLDSVQAIVFKSISSLTMCGKEINKILKQSVITSKYKTKKELYKDSVYYNSSSYYKMIQYIDRIPFSYLIPLDKESTSLPQLSPIPTPMINDIIPIDTKSIFIAAVLKQEGEIRIINTKTNSIIRTLKGFDKPTTLKMLDGTRAVVLCNRELYVMDLDQGSIITKLRTVLNIRKPLFGLQNSERVVVLSRDRMVVHVIDLKTNTIVSSFKAGETRFLESLLLSGDGKTLVCGDETQKPYPLLTWSLEQAKLVYDIRMSQHQFLTDLADITYDGRYLASGCQEVSATESNFIVVYDLGTGQLLKKFKMAGLVTALAISSKCLSVIAAMDTAKLAVWDIVSGNCRLLLDGVHASVDNIQLSMDGRTCVTSCTKEYSISAHTLSMWDIDKGHLLGTHTFHAQVTCVRLSWDGHTVLAGVRGHTEPIRLALIPAREDDKSRNSHRSSSGSSGGGASDVSGGSGKGKGSSKIKRSDDSIVEEQFGSASRTGSVIQVSSSP